MGQQCVHSLLGRAGEARYAQLARAEDGDTGNAGRPPTLAQVTSRIEGTMTLLDQRARHLEQEGVRKRRRALALRRQGDRRRARLVFLESRHMERNIETLFGLMTNLQTLKYQVQQTRLVADALQTMSEYTAISQQLREMEKKFDVETLMETIREDSERLGEMEQVLTESLLPAEQEDAIDRELAALEEREAKAALAETLQQEEGEWQKAEDKKKTLASDKRTSLMDSLSSLFNDDSADEHAGDASRTLPRKTRSSSSAAATASRREPTPAQ